MDDERLAVAEELDPAWRAGLARTRGLCTGWVSPLRAGSALGDQRCHTATKGPPLTRTIRRCHPNAAKNSEIDVKTKTGESKRQAICCGISAVAESRTIVRPGAPAPFLQNQRPTVSGWPQFLCSCHVGDHRHQISENGDMNDANDSATFIASKFSITAGDLHNDTARAIHAG